MGLTLAATRDTALALHYAHNFTDARGRKQIVIHRDVAEKNIMVTYEGVTKLLDFGIAKALGRSGRTSIGMVKGTSGYMSPEQIRGEPLDPRSDIFALGVVMHECLTGLRLFHGKTPEEGMMAALREEVLPPSKWNKEVNAELDALVLKALQRDREKRFNTALEFARAIEKAAPGLIWHPEQLGEVVTRHFSERRAETRRLLESAEFGSETTGEVRVENVMAQVRAGAATTASLAAEPARKASLISAPRAVMPRNEPEMTRPGVMPGDLKNPPQPSSTSESTSPARPRALRGPSASGVTAPSPALARPFSYEDDDDAGDKTIPAAALPDEIRNLRAQFAANRKSVSDKSPVLSPPVNEPKDRARTLTPAAPAGNTVLPPRNPTGETISITHKGNPMDWEDDDDGAKTAIAKPGELPGLLTLRGARRPPPAPVSFSAASVEQPPPRALPAVDSFDDLSMVRPRRTGLILTLLVLAMLAVGGLLVLLEIVPLPRFPGTRRVGALVSDQRGSQPG